MVERDNSGRYWRRMCVVSAAGAIALWNFGSAAVTYYAESGESVVKERVQDSPDDFLKGALAQQQKDRKQDVTWDLYKAGGASITALILYGTWCRRPRGLEVTPEG